MEIIGITALFLYFDIRLLVVVIISSLLSYIISRYSDILRRKYDIHWKFSLGQKVYFYSDLFLRSFPELATNGAIKTTLNAYEKLLREERIQGLRKNWSELTWTISGLLTGSLSEMTIKIIVGYSVFQGTQSIGMVALVVSSMGTIGDIMTRLLTVRKEYFHLRFQESSVLLFLEMCEPIGHIDTFSEKLQNLTLENIGFAYPNLTLYEKQYMDIVKDFIRHGKTGQKWIDDAFDSIIKEIEADIDKEMPIILENVSVQLEVGKIYGIVGKNGAGKTTMMQLLAGFFRSYRGIIRFNDQDIRNWTPELLANQVSFLTQEPFFMGYGSSIRENILLGVEKYDEAIIWEYLEKFNLAEKIRKNQKGLESEIGEDIEFSGGEKQILTFIRLLLQDRSIIIMDEGTNQLDAENELIVMNELLCKKQDKIIIFITHRMSTISRVDCIYCLEEKVISASGMHKHLLVDGSNAYARFYKAQVMHETVL